jgi:L-lactate utilization protein LutB
VSERPPVSAFEQMRPERSYDRLAFISPDVDQGRLNSFGPNLERVFECTVCRRHIAVGPCFEHIDPETFVGAACGCLTVETLPGLDTDAEAAGNDGTSQETGRNG